MYQRSRVHCCCVDCTRYEDTAKDPAYTNTYVFDNFVQQDIVQNDTKVDELVEFFMSVLHAPSNDSYVGCTGTMIGGGWFAGLIVVVVVVVVRTNARLDEVVDSYLDESSQHSLQGLLRWLHWHLDWR